MVSCFPYCRGTNESDRHSEAHCIQWVPIKTINCKYLAKTQWLVKPPLNAKVSSVSIADNAVFVRSLLSMFAVGLFLYVCDAHFDQ